MQFLSLFPDILKIAMSIPTKPTLNRVKFQQLVDKEDSNKKNI